MKQEQLLLPLYPETELDKLTRELAEMKMSTKKNHRSQHAKIGQMMKIVLDVKNRFEAFEAAVAKGTMELRF